MLDFSDPAMRLLIEQRGWRSLGEFERIKAIYDSPDLLLSEHHQEMSAFKAFVYRNLGRRPMNRNVAKVSG